MSKTDVSPEEIRDIRYKYHLSQQSFARLLGIGEASMVRYENGQTPTRANANLIRAASKPSFMRDCLERDGGLIPEAQRREAERIVYSLITLDAEGDIASMTDIYLITLEQEVLNEKAANVLADLHRMEHEAQKSGNDFVAKAIRFIIAELALLKPEITTLENASHPEIDELKGRVAALEHMARMIVARAA